eukprot:g22734.t1
MNPRSWLRLSSWVLYLAISFCSVTAKWTKQRNNTTYMHTENKKLEKLGIITSSSQASPHTTVETTTRKSIINLSDHILQLDKIKVLSQGLNFCPTTKMDPIERSVVGLVKNELNWTPPEGRCPGHDMYAEAIRECINTRFINRTHKVVLNITQAQRNTIHALKTNRNIVIKPAKEETSSYRIDYCKE